MTINPPKNVEDFEFDLDAKRVRISDEAILASLRRFAEAHPPKNLTTTHYDKWKGHVATSDTISERFGSWKDALARVSVVASRKRRYSPAELIGNLEQIWQTLKYAPGKRAMATYGTKISERPYKAHWGSVRKACEALQKYKKGRITQEELLRGVLKRRQGVTCKARVAVLERDKFKCTFCGRSKKSHPSLVLEVDHKTAVSLGGSNDMDNLQTLCHDCNQGKKDREIRGA